jgi:hypothetical protein
MHAVAVLMEDVVARLLMRMMMMMGVMLLQAGVANELMLMVGRGEDRGRGATAAGQAGGEVSGGKERVLKNGPKGGAAPGVGMQQQADKRRCRRRKTVGDGVLVLGYPTVCVLKIHKNWMKFKLQFCKM